MKITIKEALMSILIIVLVGFSIFAWYHHKPDGTSTAQPQGPVFQGGDSQTKPTQTIKTEIKYIEKEKIVEKEKLVKVWPDWFKEDKVLVIADKTLPAYAGRTYVIATINTETGVGGISYVHLPRSYFEWLNETKISLGYIAIGDKAGKMQAEITYTPFRFGSFEIAGFGQADDSARAGVKLIYTW